MANNNGKTVDTAALIGMINMAQQRLDTCDTADWQECCEKLHELMAYASECGVRVHTV